MGLLLCKGSICVLPIQHLLIFRGYSAYTTLGERRCLAVKKVNKKKKVYKASLYYNFGRRCGHIR